MDKPELARSRAEYLQKLRDPRWQKMRLQILERDEWTCQLCCDDQSTLTVHHRYYLQDREPWNYPAEALVTLCETCHASETEIRPAVEQRLLRALKSKFLCADLDNLSEAIEAMPMTHLPEVVASALAWALGDRAVQRDLVDQYLSSLSDGPPGGHP